MKKYKPPFMSPHRGVTGWFVNTSFLVFSIKDTETLSNRPKNFLLSQVNKGQILNCYRFLRTIPLLGSQKTIGMLPTSIQTSHTTTNNLLKTFQTEF